MDWAYVLLEAILWFKVGTLGKSIIIYNELEWDGRIKMLGIPMELSLMSNDLLRREKGEDISLSEII